MAYIYDLGELNLGHLLNSCSVVVYASLVLSGFQYVPWAGMIPVIDFPNVCSMIHSVFSVFGSTGPCPERQELATIRSHIPPVISSSGNQLCALTSPIWKTLQN